jgi:hypothetical protein
LSDAWDPDRPLRPDDRFAVDVARFLDGRPDPSLNVHPAGSGPLDMAAMLESQEQLDRIVG